MWATPTSARSLSASYLRSGLTDIHTPRRHAFPAFFFQSSKIVAPICRPLPTPAPSPSKKPRLLPAYVGSNNLEQSVFTAGGLESRGALWSLERGLSRGSAVPSPAVRHPAAVMLQQPMAGGHVYCLCVVHERGKPCAWLFAAWFSRSCTSWANLARQC
jgi:hypothetical protein